jgi:signal peptidase I
MFSGIMRSMESNRPFQIKKQSPRRHIVWQLLLSVIGAIGLAAVLNVFVFQSYYVDGESMSPTLHTNDRLIISKVERSWSVLKREAYVPIRGQIIVIDGQVSPSTAAAAPHLIKRVVGIPGDKIVINQDGVTLYSTQYPNGTDLNKLLGLSLDPTYTDAPMTVTVAPRTVFVMGDNRKEGGSYDSRIFGAISTDYIVGRLAMRILPLNHERVF